MAVILLQNVDAGVCLVDAALSVLPPWPPHHHHHHDHHKHHQDASHHAQDDGKGRVELHGRRQLTRLDHTCWGETRGTPLVCVDMQGFVCVVCLWKDFFSYIQFIFLCVFFCTGVVWMLLVLFIYSYIFLCFLYYFVLL